MGKLKTLGIKVVANKDTRKGVSDVVIPKGTLGEIVARRRDPEGMQVLIKWKGHSWPGSHPETDINPVIERA